MSENPTTSDTTLSLISSPTAQTPETAETKKPRRRRVSRKKAEASSDEATVETGVEAKKPARRGRPRKVKAQAEEAEGTSQSEDTPTEGKVPVRRRRARKATAEKEPQGQENGENTEGKGAPAAHKGEKEPQESVQDTKAAHEKESGSKAKEPAHNAPERAHRTHNQSRRFEHNERNNRFNNQHNQNNNHNRSNRRRNSRHNQPDTNTEPSLTRDMLKSMKVAELRSRAAELGVNYVGVRKAELIEPIYQAAAKAEGFHPISGILDVQPEGYGFIRTGNYMQGDNDGFVYQQVIRQNGLRSGDKIEGVVGPNHSNSKFPPLISIKSVNGKSLEETKHRPRFRDLTPIYPNERLKMEHGKDSITGRAIDIVAPIGKGQRGLIVSPPKAGKTTVLKKVCESIAANNPEVHLICLLVDERPEEVTDMQRSIKGEVVASTFDMPASNHTEVSELVIEHAKRLVEMGEDVVVVLDSITRLARAYNLAMPASGRILSGGVDSAALYPPKKFLGAARNIENGGSLTILASALVDTGSKMDEVIFEEFKGTGNMELKLDRDLADKRIFPAIDPVASGTRNEELLLDPEERPFIWGIRRVLANMNNTERAETALVKSLKATDSNEEFLIRSAKKAAQQSNYIEAL